MGKRTSQKREYYYEGDILFLKCSRCEKFKQEIEFGKNKNRSFGLNCYCKECAREKGKEFYNGNRDVVNAYGEKYYENNKKRILKKHKEWADKNMTKERMRGYQRKYKEKNHAKLIERNKATRKKMRREGKYSNREREKKMSENFGYSTTLFHSRATSYIKKNNLRPKNCMACGKTGDIEFHHPSYDNINKWKEGVFLCRCCHKLIHTGELDCPEPVDLIQLNAHMPTILTDKELELCRS